MSLFWRAAVLHARSLYPSCTTPAGLACTWFGLRPFRSPLLGVSLAISFPPGTEMFHFSGLPPVYRLTGCPVKVAPFRDPRVTGCLLLSAAFRSLLRLSSAFSAKAFPSCFVYLNLINPLFTCRQLYAPSASRRRLAFRSNVLVYDSAPAEAPSLRS